MIRLDGGEQKISNKVLDEKETRKRLLSHARLLGREREMLIVFNKFDKLLKNCTNEKERLDIAKLGAVEMFKVLGGVGDLYVNNEVVFKEK